MEVQGKMTVTRSDEAEARKLWLAGQISILQSYTKIRFQEMLEKIAPVEQSCENLLATIEAAERELEAARAGRAQADEKVEKLQQYMQVRRGAWLFTG